MLQNFRSVKIRLGTGGGNIARACSIVLEAKESREQQGLSKCRMLLNKARQYLCILFLSQKPAWEIILI